MAIILPQEGNIWQTLGSGLGAGINQLAQGKAQQIQKRYFADTLKQAGYDPGVAQSIAFADPRLQPHLLKQHAKGLESLSKQKQDEALFQQGIAFGGDPEALRRAHAAGNLSKAIDKLSVADNPSFGQRFGLTSSKSNQYRLTPEKQKLRSLVSELNPENHSQQQGLAALQQNIYNNGSISDEQLLAQSLEDPNIPTEKKLEIREALQGVQGNDWGYGLGTIAGSLGNFLSNAASNAGSGFNALQYLPNMGPTPEQKLKFKERLEDTLKNADPNSADYDEAKTRLEHINDKDVFKSSSEFKEDFIRPVAKALGVEKHIDPKNPVETLFGRMGNVAPAALATTLIGGGPIAAGLLNQAKISALAEGAGQLTQYITGSKLGDAVVSTLGYILPGIVSPGFFSNIVGRGYKNFEKMISGQSAPRIDASGIVNDLGPIAEQISVDPLSSGYRFLTGRMNAIQSKVRDISEAAANKLGTGRVTIDPKKLYELDKAFGKQFSQAENLGVSAEFQQMREVLRKYYQNWASGINPDVTKGLIAAREAERSLRSNSTMEKILDAASKTRVPLLSQAGHALKVLANIGKHGLKGGKVILTNPVARNEAIKLLADAANDNKAGLYASAQKLYDMGVR